MELKKLMPLFTT